MNVGIVILHYKTYEDTIVCTKSFLNNKNNNKCEIVIVDNYSNNDSLEVLLNEFKNQNNVHIISTDYNMGYAKGNNFGAQYLKKLNIDFDYVIFCNNDTYIKDDMFFEKILTSIKENKCGVLGPDIIRIQDNIHQNPLKTPKWNKFSINKKIIEYSIKIIILKIVPFIVNMKNKKSNNTKKREEQGNIIQKNVCLHGAALIFSKSYLEKFENVFYDKTFLYLEEDILYLRCKKNNIRMIYDNTIKIYHNHSSSTKSIYKDEVKRKKFFLKNQISSFKVLKKYLKKGE